MSERRKNTNITAPSWFKLEKYDKQVALDLRGWLVQFGVRRDLQAYLEGLDMDIPDGLAKRVSTIILGWLHEDPILQWDRLLDHFGPLKIQLLFPSLRPLHNWQPRNDMAVHPTTVEELYRAQNLLHPGFRTDIDKFYEQMQKGIEHGRDTGDYYEELEHRIKMRRALPELEISRDEVEEKIPFHPRLSHPLYCTSMAMGTSLLFTVNVALPDKLIEAHLRDAVQRARKYFEHVLDVSTRLSTNPEEDWSDEQLLAYLDLSFDKYLSDGVRLSEAEIAQLIWPRDRPGKATDKEWDWEHLHSTTAPLAVEMMADYSEAFWTLQARVAALLADDSLDAKSPDNALSATMVKPKTRRNRWKNK